MNTVAEIAENIKDMISNEVNGRVFDKHVCAAIGVNESTFRTAKKCNTHASIIYSVCEFCHQRGADIGTVLYGTWALGQS